jgi:hypothetical protein
LAKESYTVSAAEIQSNRSLYHNDKSLTNATQGDRDDVVIALNIAAEKFMKNETTWREGRDGINGGLPEDFARLFNLEIANKVSGHRFPEIRERHTKKRLLEYAEANPGNISLMFYANGGDGTGFERGSAPNHAFYVTDIDPKTEMITYKNPSDFDVSHTVSLDSFLNRYVSGRGNDFFDIFSLRVPQ